jgi:hypothetical protein
MGQVLTIMAAFPSAFPRTDYPMSYEEPGVHRLLVAAWQRSRRWERLAEEGELADGVNLELLALAMFDYTLWM